MSVSVSVSVYVCLCVSVFLLFPLLFLSRMLEAVNLKLIKLISQLDVLPTILPHEGNQP